MEWCYKYILQYILLNDDDQAVSIERFKMMANGLRIIALAILAAAIIAPLFNPALKRKARISINPATTPPPTRARKRLFTKGGL